MKKSILIAFVFAGFMASAQNYTRMSYPISWGVGATADYTSMTSWLGYHVEFGHQIHRNSYFGLETGWVTLYDERRNYSQEIGTTTLTGTQYRYFNSIPILAKYTYRLGDIQKDFRPFVAGAAGISWSERQTEVGIFSIYSDEWPLTTAAELGFTYDVGSTSLLTVSAYYNYQFSRGDLPAANIFGIRIGAAWE